MHESTARPDQLIFREAGPEDVPEMSRCREGDLAAGPADPRMSAYFAGRHHPQKALSPRTGFVAIAGGAIVGYIAGHLTTRLGCEGELQYLYVAPAYRRKGAATMLVNQLARWFLEQSARRICVNVNPDSDPASPFYLRLGAVPKDRYWYIWPDISAALPSARQAPSHMPHAP